MNAQIVSISRMNNLSIPKSFFSSPKSSAFPTEISPFFRRAKSIAERLHFNNNPILFSRPPFVLIAKLIKSLILVCFASFGIYGSMRKLHFTNFLGFLSRSWNCREKFTFKPIFSIISRSATLRYTAAGYLF